MYMVMQEQLQHLHPDKKARKAPLFHVFPDIVVIIVIIIIILKNAML